MKAFIRYFLIIFVPMFLICFVLLLIDTIQNDMMMDKGILAAMAFILLTFPTGMAFFASVAYGKIVTVEYDKLDEKKQSQIIEKIDLFAMNEVCKTVKVLVNHSDSVETIYYDKNPIRRWMKYPLKIVIKSDKLSVIGSIDTMKKFNMYINKKH
ncbi:hypothetical protein [Clostridium thermarum]|uniref:hypothetical protein n=1 Tax=Clostridium thermarum TaxID=1716543 RepID=UPI00111CE09F|nr:hypothetical protein [Clostridium thermarum]